MKGSREERVWGRRESLVGKKERRAGTPVLLEERGKGEVKNCFSSLTGKVCALCE